MSVLSENRSRGDADGSKPAENGIFRLSDGFSLFILTVGSSATRNERRLLDNCFFGADRTVAGQSGM